MLSLILSHLSKICQQSSTFRLFLAFLSLIFILNMGVKMGAEEDQFECYSCDRQRYEQELIQQLYYNDNFLPEGVYEDEI